MLIATGTYRIGVANLSGDLDDLRVKVKRDGPRSKLKIEPKTPEEYLFKEFHAKFKYMEGKKRGGTVAFPDGFIITASRLLMIATRRDDKKGVDHFVIATANRSDFPNVNTVKDRKGEVKSIELTSVDRSATITISFASKGLAQVLDWLDPSSAVKLDQAAAEERRNQNRIENEKRADDARQAKLAQLEVAKSRFHGTAGQASARLGSLISTGGILDHRKTFYYKVAGTSEACIAAFQMAFESGGGLLLRAGWTLQRSPGGAVANYEGRKGLGAIGAALSQSAASEQAGAVDSKVQFQIDGEDEQYTYCSMWLAEHGSRIGFVSDGRFIKPYMRSVETELVKLDSEVEIIKV
jgi:hypothetical protein